MELTFALAYRFLGTRENRFARFVTWVSFIGLTLGVSILTVVVTVMNGFDNELRGRLLQTIPHITASSIDTEHPAAQSAAMLPDARSVHEYFSGIGAITNRSAVRPVRIYGASQHGLESLDFLSANLINTSFSKLREQRAGILLGAPLANLMNLIPGDPVTLVVT